MTEKENTYHNDSEAQNPFKAIAPDAKLPLRVRNEVVGTMEIVSLFGNILQLFTSNFGNTLVSMVGHQDDDNEDNMRVALDTKNPIPLNDNSSTLI